jgi:hypothetical protein
MLGLARPPPADRLDTNHVVHHDELLIDMDYLLARIRPAVRPAAAR